MVFYRGARRLTSAHNHRKPEPSKKLCTCQCGCETPDEIRIHATIHVSDFIDARDNWRSLEISRDSYVGMAIACLNILLGENPTQERLDRLIETCGPSLVEDSINFRATLDKISRVNACDYEYQRWARTALNNSSTKEPKCS